MKTRNLSKWLILLLCACVVTFHSCDKSDYDQKDRKEMKKQEEEKKKQEEEKKKQEEEKKKQEEEKKKQEEEKKKQEEEKKKQEEEKKKQEEEKKKQEEEKKKQEEEKKKQEEEEARRKKEEEEKQKQLTLDPTSITLAPIVTKNIHIKNGTAPYEVQVADGKIALAKVYDKENYIAVTGLGLGTTEIVVTDKNMKTGKVTVTVSTGNLQPIKVSKANVALSVGKSENVNIQSGRYPYKAEAVDKSVVEVKVTDATITIKALKEGRTDVNVTDRVGAKGRISVVVSK